MVENFVKWNSERPASLFAKIEGIKSWLPLYLKIKAPYPSQFVTFVKYVSILFDIILLEILTILAKIRTKWQLNSAANVAKYEKENNVLRKLQSYGCRFFSRKILLFHYSFLITYATVKYC